MSEILDRLVAENPSIAEQMNSWQSERSSSGENATDWEAFRAHLASLGAPDPGDEAPEEFTNYSAG